MPKPKIYIIPGPQINAFATGRDPQHSVIAVTEGALDKLNKQELEGVIGHELSHIANYDIRFMTLTAVLVGMIAIISQIFLRSLFFGGGRSKNKNNAIFLIIGISFTNPAIAIIAKYGFLINTWLGLFNLIPVWNFDGKKILAWNKVVYFSMVVIAFALMFMQGVVSS